MLACRDYDVSRVLVALASSLKLYEGFEGSNYLWFTIYVPGETAEVLG